MKGKFKISISKNQFVSIYYLIMLLIIQLPWIEVKSNLYNIYKIYIYSKTEGLNGFSKNVQVMWENIYHDPEVMLVNMLFLELIIFVFFQEICITHIILTFFKRKSFLDILLVCIMFFIANINSEGIGAVAENVFADVFPMIIIIICCIGFLGTRLLEEWDESIQIAKIRKEEEKRLRAERRRRLFFPGRYGRVFYKIVWSSLVYCWKDYSIFIICGITVNSILFAEFGLQKVLSQFHTEESFLISQGIQQIMLESMLMIGLIGILLTITILNHYIKTRIKGYGIFTALGIRKNALVRIIAIEWGVSFVISIIIGYLIGNIFLILIKYFIEYSLNVCLGTIGIEPYWQSLLGTSFIQLLSLLVVRDIHRDFNISISLMKKVIKEKLPEERKSWFSCFISFLVIVGCFYEYSQIKNYENIIIVCVCFLALFWLMQNGVAICMKMLKRGRKYLTKILSVNQLNYRIKTTTSNLFGLSIIHILVLFYFSFQIVSVLIAESPEELYPYDFVCIADENDTSFFENLQIKYNIEIIEYPMVRISNVDKTQEKESLLDKAPNFPAMPIGQQIGISETTYHELQTQLNEQYQKSDLLLDSEGEKIFIVHQQDKSIKAQPIDWYGSRKKPYLYIGQPCYWYSSLDLEDIFQTREIAGEEIASLIGCFRQGNLENLVVFSDEYFQKAQEAWKCTNYYTGEYIENEEERIIDVTIHQGPTRLVLIRANSCEIEKIEKELDVFRKSHEYDTQFDNQILSCYSKSMAIQDIKTERIMKIVVNMFIIIILFLANSVYLGIKVISEINEKKDRSVLLECMGMRHVERKKLLKKELYIFFFAPLIIAMVISSFFIITTFVARMYTIVDIYKFIRNISWIWMLYMLMEWLLIWALGRVTVWKVEARHEK